MEIPAERLDSATLRAIVDEFVTREGTDYGDQIHTLDEKAAQVLRQINTGEVCVLFDPTTATVTLALRDQFRNPGRSRT